MLECHQDVVKVRVFHDTGEYHVLHDFAQHTRERHRSIVGSSASVPLLEDSSGVGISPISGYLTCV